MEKLSSTEIRNLWIKYFKSKGHNVMESAPLVPYDDDSLLFINAGVTPLKKYFDGSVVPENKRNPLNTTTYGVGELIINAIKNGAKNFLATRLLVPRRSAPPLRGPKTLLQKAQPSLKKGLASQCASCIQSSSNHIFLFYIPSPNRRKGRLQFQTATVQSITAMRLPLTAGDGILPSIKWFKA